MQVGHDQQTSTKYKSGLWFGLDKQSRATEFNIIYINFTQQLFLADESQNISTAESPARCASFYEQTFHDNIISLFVFTILYKQKPVIR